MDQIFHHRGLQTIFPELVQMLIVEQAWTEISELIKLYKEQPKTHNVKKFCFLQVNLRGIDVGEREVRDHDPGGDLEGEVGGDQGVVVEAGAVHDVGEPHQGRVPHLQGGVVQGVAETVQCTSSIASDPENSR